eukprot:scaffold25784_cov152-Cylindrotheca_fusiformis.AAC.1
MRACWPLKIPSSFPEEMRQKITLSMSNLHPPTLHNCNHRGSSTWGRFSAIYYNLHGLNSQHIGIIEGIRGVIPTISQVFWGVVADGLRSQKKVWLLTKTVSTLVLLTLALPAIYSSFARILTVSIVAQLFVSDGILDAFTLDMLGPENKIYYGRYRMYASLSWGAGSIVMGWITDHFGFEPNFIMFGLLGALMIILVATRIPDTSTDPTNSLLEDANTGKFKELVLLFLRPRTLYFLLEVIIMGAGMATVERLLFLYLVNDLQASTLLCGLSVGVNVLFELPIFWYASKFMALFGHDGLFIIAMICFVVRVYGYTLLTPDTKWLILLLEIMHGVTFACFWIASTDISKIMVHETSGAFWSTAIPSSVNMLYSAVGSSLGSVVGGWAMNRYGSREMYTFTACIVFGTLVVHILGTIVSKICFDSGFLPAGDNEDESSEREEQDGVVSDDEDRSRASETLEDTTNLLDT